MAWLLHALWLVLQVLVVFLASTVVFDIVHYLLHLFARSSNPLLRWAGGLHETHHRFLDRNLEIRREYQTANLYRHVIPEYSTQVAFCLCLLWLLPAVVVVSAMALQTLVFLLILREKGMDINHRTIERLPAYRPMFFCLPPYHALHHVHPDAHFSSWIKAFDYALGTGAWLEGRRVAITGATTPVGAELARELEARWHCGVTALELPEPGSAVVQEALERAEILVLGHVSGAAADEAWERSYGELIESYYEVAGAGKLPIEVWAVEPVSAREERPGTDFASRARGYYEDPRVIYRHIVLPRDSSRDPRTAASRALSRIRRGFNYVPTGSLAERCTGFLRFRFGALKAP